MHFEIMNSSNKIIEENFPHSLEIEKYILSGMINNEEIFLKILLNNIKKFDFFSKKNLLIFKSLIYANNQKLKINPITVFEIIKKIDKNNLIKNIKEIYDISLEIPSKDSISTYIKILKEKSTLRKLIFSANKIKNFASSKNIEVTDAIIEAEKIILEITRNNLNKSNLNFKETLYNTLEKIKDIASQKKETSGLSSGIKGFDIATCGLHRGELIVIAARPSMGKTSLVLSIGLHISSKLKKSIAFFSMEMSAEQILYRLISMYSEISLQKIRSGNINDLEIKKLFKYCKNISNIPFYVDESPILTISLLRNKCRKLIKNCSIQLIIVDYLQLIDGGKFYSNKVAEISDISKGLKSIAREFNIPVIAVSQLNRGAELRTNKKPIMSDLRESGAIEQDADIVGMLYREEYYKKENVSPKMIGKAELIISKNRNGPTGTVWLNFDNKIIKFSNLY